jgi:hypothetical protein
MHLVKKIKEAIKHMLAIILFFQSLDQTKIRASIKPVRALDKQTLPGQLSLEHR